VIAVCDRVRRILFYIKHYNKYGRYNDPKAFTAVVTRVSNSRREPPRINNSTVEYRTLTAHAVKQRIIINYNVLHAVYSINFLLSSAAAVAITINPAEHDLRVARRRRLLVVELCRVRAMWRSRIEGDANGIRTHTRARSRNDPQKAVPPTGVHYAHNIYSERLTAAL